MRRSFFVAASAFVVYVTSCAAAIRAALPPNCSRRGYRAARPATKRPALGLVVALGALLGSSLSAQADSTLPLQLPWRIDTTMYISSGGYGYNCGDHLGKDGYAIDFPFPTGTPITATASGIAHNRNDGNGYGNMVWIDHGGGYTSVYGHLSAFSLADGSSVVAGQQVGLSGSTGFSTGPHLHWAVRWGATGPYDGNAYLPEPASAYSGFGAYGYCTGVSSPPYWSFPESRGTAVSRYNGSYDHWVTSDAVPASYSLEGVLGYFDPTNDSGTQAVYSCQLTGLQPDGVTHDHFLSGDSNCEGQTFLRLNGFMYTSQQTNTVAVYRCRLNTWYTDHFASTDSGCEGQSSDGLIGWALKSAGLYRWVASTPRDHWSLAGPPPSPYLDEGYQGQLTTTGDTSIYDCLISPADHFLSNYSNCEGHTVLGLAGRLTSSPTARPLYRCHQSSPFEIFESNVSNCEGYVYDTFLGYG
ncbi:MAG: M23 family metallopeptidase [Candidatus Dormibacteria bacterium]